MNQNINSEIIVQLFFFPNAVQQSNNLKRRSNKIYSIKENGLPQINFALSGYLSL